MAETATSGVVDWALARRTASAVAGAGGAPESTRYGAADITAACTEGIASASAYARLPVPGRWPQPEVVDRSEWSRNALATIELAAEPLERRLAGDLSMPAPLDGIARRLIGAGTGVEAGIAVGFVGRRVLAQYDAAVIGPERGARLLFVDANLEATRVELAADSDLFLRWVALHETTHVLQFESVPWLLGHVRDLARGLIGDASASIDAAQIGGLVRRFVRAPRELARHLMRGELAELLATPAQRERLDRLQATMAVIEGHAEHVMDACAADDPRLAGLRSRLDQRRARRSGLGEIAARLLGLEMKRRQYELGKRFWDHVVAERGEVALEQVWSAPGALPSLAELERPQAWLARATFEPAGR